jgi:hypothetical protein
MPLSPKGAPNVDELLPGLGGTGSGESATGLSEQQENNMLGQLLGGAL